MMEYRHRKVKTRLTLTQEINRGLKHLTICVIVLNVLFISLYIGMNSAFGTNGYTLTKLQKYHRELLEEQKQLEKKLTEARSIHTIEQEIKSKEMTELEPSSTEITYANPSSYKAQKKSPSVNN